MAFQSGREPFSGAKFHFRLGLEAFSGPKFHFRFDLIPVSGAKFHFHFDLNPHFGPENRFPTGWEARAHPFSPYSALFRRGDILFYPFSRSV